MLPLCTGVVLLVTSQVLGGGTRQGFLGDFIVNCIAAVCLCLLIVARPGSSRLLLLLCAGLATLVLAQLFLPLLAVPAGLPPLSMDAAGNSSWGSVSLTPHATIASVLSALTPLAVLASVMQATARQRVTMAWTLVSVCIASLLLGFAQVAGGAESPLRFFAFTNPTEAVGFFANRNHFAAQLYVTLMLALAGFATLEAGRPSLKGASGRTLISMSAAAVLLIGLVAGLALARSRAGITLAGAAMVAGAILIATIPLPSERMSRPRSGSALRKSAYLVVGGCVVFFLQFGLHNISSRFEDDLSVNLRWPLASTTFEAAWQALPFGTGLGSFVPVYAALESREHVFVGYANRAHNDFAELLLETGIFGAAAILGLLIWWARASFLAWRRPLGGQVQVQVQLRHLLLQRAASIIILLLLAHSLVDYPLRTTALAAVFAFSCGLLTKPAHDPLGDTSSPRAEATSPRSAKEASPRRPSEAIVGAAASGEATRGPLADNGLSGVTWPESWQRAAPGDQARPSPPVEDKDTGKA